MELGHMSGPSARSPESSPMRQRAKAVLLLLIGALNLALWLQPGPVVQYVARDEPTLLGYYSVERFSANVAVLLLSATASWLLLSTAPLRPRMLKLASVALAVAVTLVAGEYIVRALTPAPQYVLHADMRHRQPDSRVQAVFRDRPEAVRSYPRRPPGYGDVPLVVATDERGFRNPARLGNVDIVVIGDSFVEGPEVDYEQLWTVRLSHASALSVYNMGTAGENVGGYVAKMERFAPTLHPQTVILMIYEGNDLRGFRAAKRSWLKDSRLRARLKNLLIERLGPVNAGAPFARAEIVDWLPLAVRADGGVAHYAFTPRNVGDLARTREEFENHRGWHQLRASIEAVHELARRHGVRLILAYAPSKVKVLLPLVADRLPADKVLAFALLHASKMPASKLAVNDGEAFLEQVRRDIQVPEAAVRKLCTQRGIEFVSLTEDLRRATAQGRQTYYTYDQHWSPIGHEVVADSLYEYLRRSGGVAGFRNPPSALAARPGAQAQAAAP